MPGKLLYWSYNNIFYSNEFTWIIQVVVTLGIIISMCFIIFSKVEKLINQKITFWTKIALAIFKLVISCSICFFIWRVCSGEEISVATLCVVILTIVQAFDALISIIEIYNNYIKELQKDEELEEMRAEIEKNKEMRQKIDELCSNTEDTLNDITGFKDSILAFSEDVNESVNEMSKMLKKNNRKKKNK